MLKYLAPYPSVVVWVLFNEGWGQANTEDGMVAGLSVDFFPPKGFTGSGKLSLNCFRQNQLGEI